MKITGNQKQKSPDINVIILFSSTLHLITRKRLWIVTSSAIKKSHDRDLGPRLPIYAAAAQTYRRIRGRTVYLNGVCLFTDYSRLVPITLAAQNFWCVLCASESRLHSGCTRYCRQMVIRQITSLPIFSFSLSSSLPPTRAPSISCHSFLDFSP